MVFFKKENSDHPDSDPSGLPELPFEKSEFNESFERLPELPEINSLPPLPPQSLVQNNVAERRTLEIPEINSGARIQQIKNTSFKKIEESRNMIQRTGGEISPKEPLFIKIDKSREAMKKFEEIKIKVSEIEDSLKKIREIKEKEESELSEWESEAHAIKEKVEIIDNSLFNKI